MRTGTCGSPRRTTNKIASIGTTPPDVTPPVISGVGVAPTASDAVVSWTTNEASSSSVAYGTTAALGQSASTAGNTTAHSVTLSGLTCNTLYHYQVSSTDPVDQHRDVAGGLDGDVHHGCVPGELPEPGGAAAVGGYASGCVDGGWSVRWWRQVGGGGAVGVAGRGSGWGAGGCGEVVLNVTVTNPVGSGYVTVFPCGQSVPLASNLNYVAGQTVPNAVVAKVGAGGKVCINSFAATDLVVDVAGYFPTLTVFVPLSAPQRLADTRPGASTADGQFAGGGKLAAGVPLELPVVGRAGVPADAASVVLNVTVTNPVGSGNVTVFPCGQSVPLASNLNYVAGQTVPNAVVAKVGAGGKVCINSFAATDLVVDVAGYFPTLTAFVPLTRRSGWRIPRPGASTADGQFAGGGKLAAGVTLELPVVGRAGVPADAARWC